jgi:hypothetical protein
MKNITVTKHISHVKYLNPTTKEVEKYTLVVEWDDSLKAYVGTVPQRPYVHVVAHGTINTILDILVDTILFGV